MVRFILLLLYSESEPPLPIGRRCIGLRCGGGNESDRCHPRSGDATCLFCVNGRKIIVTFIVLVCVWYKFVSVSCQSTAAVFRMVHIRRGSLRCLRNVIKFLTSLRRTISCVCVCVCVCVTFILRTLPSCLPS